MTSGKYEGSAYLNSLGVRYTLRGLPLRFIGAAASVASLALPVAAIANSDSDPSNVAISAINALGEPNS